MAHRVPTKEMRNWRCLPPGDSILCEGVWGIFTGVGWSARSIALQAKKDFPNRTSMSKATAIFVDLSNYVKWGSPIFFSAVPQKCCPKCPICERIEPETCQKQSPMFQVCGPKFSSPGPSWIQTAIKTCGLFCGHPVGHWGLQGCILRGLFDWRGQDLSREKKFVEIRPLCQKL